MTYTSEIGVFMIKNELYFRLYIFFSCDFVKNTSKIQKYLVIYKKVVLLRLIFENNLINF